MAAIETSEARRAKEMDAIGIAVAPVDASLRNAVLALRVDAAQLAFVSPIHSMLAAAEASPSAEPMAILLGNTVVGCYRLEYRLSVITAHAFDQCGVGLLGYFIDVRRQRRGLGTQALAAVCEDLRLRHPELGVLALNVACNNAPAIRAYRRAGFEDCGPPHAGGPGGPQQLMMLQLTPANPRRPPARI